ncbi:MAG: S9 family peptidase [Myxococcales bacterium]|nr:S9 family peptidase [Myxococcales bacterium]MDH5306536.1 S9 family peptidase [Myxococcales bacterium]MDH5565556.1 S9 family peptidase [Myxococcales bacterium]
MLKQLSSLLAFIACASPWFAAAEVGRMLRVTDLDSLKQVSDPQISPDGAWVAYAVRGADPGADTSTSDLWMTRWDGSETVRLTDTPESEHAPRWSPDGRRLAFLSARGDASGAEQLWLLDWRGGGSERVTALEGGISDFDWAPDARHLVLVSSVVPAGAADTSTPQPIVITRMLIKRDGYGYLGRSRARLHLLDLEARSVVQLTAGPHDEIRPAFSPDGGRIAYVTKLGDDPDRHLNWDILAIEPLPGATPQRVSSGELMECDPIWGWGSSPVWSPDGRQLACEQSGPLELSWFTLQQVAVFPAGGGVGKQPTASLDRNTTRPHFSPDGARLFFLLEDDQSVVLASVSTEGGALQRLTPAGRSVSAYDIGPNGKIAVLSSTSDQPPELAAVEGGVLRPLTHVNEAWVAALRLSEAENLVFESADGTQIHGLLMRPPGSRSGVKLPTILRLHGGPVAQWQHAFDFTWQILAAHGYAVVGPNPRGSSGRGEAFQRAIFGDWGNADVPDVLASVDHVVARGVADAGRLGVGGWSSGAMLTNYTIASDTRFRAATSGAGVSNMLAGYGTDEWWHDWEAELGLPWEGLEKWLRVSYPFLHADRIRTPTLFLCGAEDHNVPVMHSEQMYMALRRLGVPTELVVYPGESHGIQRPSFRRDVLSRYLAWYARWLE